jgi:ADP-ribose pyrophosphatase YjhB (NUDIX family)
MVVELTEKYPYNVVTIFVLPPSKEEQWKRLVERTGQAMEEQQSRIRRLDTEMQYAGVFEYVVINDILSQAVDEVCAIIRAERNRHAALKNRVESGDYHLFHGTVAALVLDGEKVLLVRSQTGPESDYWRLPGGHVREGEYPHEAVLRHTAENTGYQVEIVPPWADAKTTPPVVSVPRPWDTLLEDVKNHYDYNYIYMCKVKKRMTIKEASEIRWFAIMEVSGLRVSPTAQSILQKFSDSRFCSSAPRQSVLEVCQTPRMGAGKSTDAMGMGV